MKRWEPKQIIVLILVLLLAYHLTLLFVAWITGKNVSDAGGSKEIFIFILGIVSAYIADKSVNGKEK